MGMGMGMGMDMTLKSALLHGFKLHPLPRVHYIPHDSSALASLAGNKRITPSPHTSFPFYYLSLFPESQLDHARLVSYHPTNNHLAQLIPWPQLPLSFFSIVPKEMVAKEATPAPNDFIELSFFTACLHRILQSNLHHDDELVAQAKLLGSGWLHIADERAPAPCGRIPDPQDIFASVRVQDGQLLIDTYAPMPTYRLITREGRFKLKRNYNEALESYLKLAE